MKKIIEKRVEGNLVNHLIEIVARLYMSKSKVKDSWNYHSKDGFHTFNYDKEKNLEYKIPIGLLGKVRDPDGTIYYYNVKSLISNVLNGGEYTKFFYIKDMPLDVLLYDFNEVFKEFEPTDYSIFKEYSTCSIISEPTESMKVEDIKRNIVEALDNLKDVDCSEIESFQVQTGSIYHAKDYNKPLEDIIESKGLKINILKK